MATKVTLINSILRVRNLSSSRRAFTAGRVIYNKPQGSVKASSDGNVAGLSGAVLKVPKEPVGPGASKSTDYKNPEYFSYHSTSYFEAEIELLQYRLPQPSNH